jgi:hypothetical protein
MEAREETRQGIDFKYISAMFLIVLMLLTVSPVVSYGGDGNLTLAAPPPPTTGICSDGTDNDGDTLTDGEDPGCTKPYALDRSEYDMRDTDLSYNLYDDTPPDSDDLTLFVPGSTKRHYLLKAIDESKVPKTDQNQIYESYLDQLGYAQWAGGEQKWELLTVGGAVSVNPGFRTGEAITNEPVSPEFLFDEDGVRTCGNGDREMDEGNNLGCPQDFGFPDQLRDSSADGKRTQDKVSTDISSELGDFEADVGIDHDGDGDSLQSDNPDYTMDFVGEEASGTVRWDISGEGEPTQPEPIDHAGIDNAPDFYGSNRDLYKIYPYAEDSGNQETVTDYDIEKEENIKGYFKDGDGETYYDCKNPGENMTCVDKDQENQECTSVDNHQVNNYTVNRDDEVTVNIDTEKYEIKNNDGQEDEWEDPGYERDITDQNLEVIVTRDKLTGNNEQDAPNCDGWSGEKCVLKPGESSGGSCDLDPVNEDVYEEREINIDNLKSGDAYTDKSSGSIEVKYEKIRIKDDKVFSTKYETNDDLDSDTSSIQALFGNEYSSVEDKIIDKGSYYGFEQSISPRDFSNSPAYSASRFKIVVQDNKFHSKRDYYGVWNVDGKNGFGDSFVAIKEGDIENENGPFLNETSIEVGSGGNPGYIDANENVNFVTPSDYSSPSCPGQSIFCVSAADVSVKPWDDWASGNSPGFEIETIDTVNVSESWGACRKYQELIGGARESILRCQYDWDDDFPSGPTPFWEPPVVGGEN